MSILFYQRKILYSCKLLMNVHVVFSASALFRLETVEQLTGSNFPKWKNAMQLCLAFSEFDYTLINEKPTAPASGAAGYEELKKGL
jgi:hypothetical protein